MNRAIGTAGARPADMARAAAIFHEVRQLPYLSDGVRDPDIVAARGAGSCTGKHLLLHRRLREAGFSAEVEIVRGDFAGLMPRHPSMPEELRQMIADAGIEDFHNVVWLDGPDGRHLLDATFPDAMAAYGYDVNSDWDGTGSTRPALNPEQFIKAEPDVIAHKARLLDTLPAETLARRARFLKILSDWIMTEVHPGHAQGTNNDKERTDT